MSKLSCEQCQMSIKLPVCAECSKELVFKTVEIKNKKIQVSECPSGCGRIKSPQCCGHDMQVKNK